jgi:beta-glucosidase
LLDAHDRYELPIYVLENGAGAVEKPDASGNINDQERIGYLEAYVDALRQAVSLGADIRGYFVWSLLDNFEWGAGYANRFGLVYVDYATQKRTPKASAAWYGALIRSEAQRAVS